MAPKGALAISKIKFSIFKIAFLYIRALFYEAFFNLEDRSFGTSEGTFSTLAKNIRNDFSMITERLCKSKEKFGFPNTSGNYPDGLGGFPYDLGDCLNGSEGYPYDLGDCLNGSEDYPDDLGDCPNGSEGYPDDLGDYPNGSGGYLDDLEDCLNGSEDYPDDLGHRVNRYCI